MTSSTAAINIARQQFGLDEDTYRAKLHAITGVSSLRAMTEHQRLRVLDVFRREGFAPAKSKAGERARAGGKYQAKLRALWIALYNLGVVRDKRDSAIEAFVTGQVEVDAVRFVHKASDAASVIEAMKAMLARHGVNWTNSTDAPPFTTRYGYKIARAQWQKLCPEAPQDFWAVVTDLVDQNASYRDLTDGEWIAVMNSFGVRIRKTQAGRK